MKDEGRDANAEYTAVAQKKFLFFRPRCFAFADGHENRE